MNLLPSSLRLGALWFRVPNVHDFPFLVLSIDSESLSEKIKIRETTSLHHLPECSAEQDLKMAPFVVSYGILRETYLFWICFLKFPNYLLFLGRMDWRSTKPGTQRSPATSGDGQRSASTRGNAMTSPGRWSRAGPRDALVHCLGWAQAFSCIANSAHCLNTIQQLVGRA